MGWGSRPRIVRICADCGAQVDDIHDLRECWERLRQRVIELEQELARYRGRSR